VHTQIPQRCDALRPCTTCVNAGGGSGCFYDEMRTPHHVIRSLPSAAHSFPFLDGAEPGPSNAGSFSQWSLEEDVVDLELRTDSPDSSYSSSPDSVVLEELPETTEVTSSSHELRDSWPIISGGTKRGVQSRPWHPLPSTSSRYTVLPSLRLPIVPRPLHTPLSFFPPENFQVAGVRPGDLEMSLYASPIVLLAHRSS